MNDGIPFECPMSCGEDKQFGIYYWKYVHLYQCVCVCLCVCVFEWTNENRVNEI